jgi:hypothetical protein
LAQACWSWFDCPLLYRLSIILVRSVAQSTLFLVEVLEPCGAHHPHHDLKTTISLRSCSLRSEQPVFACGPQPIVETRRSDGALGARQSRREPVGDSAQQLLDQVGAGLC